MKPHDFLDEAIKTLGERGRDNGYDNGEERSMAKIVQVFAALTGKRLTEAEGWQFMICLKLVRNERKFKPDNIVDMAGYAALLGECQASEEATEEGVRVDMPQFPGASAVLTEDMPVHPRLPPFVQCTSRQLDLWGEKLRLPRIRGARDSVESDTSYRRRLSERNSEGV